MARANGTLREVVLYRYNDPCLAVSTSAIDPLAHQTSGSGQLPVAYTARIVQTRIGQSILLDGSPFQLSWTHCQTLMRLASEGATPQKPTDLIKSPNVSVGFRVSEMRTVTNIPRILRYADELRGKVGQGQPLRDNGT